MSREGSSSEDKSPLRSFQSWDDTDVKRLELEFNLSLAEAVEFLFNKSSMMEGDIPVTSIDTVAGEGADKEEHGEEEGVEEEEEEKEVKVVEDEKELLVVEIIGVDANEGKATRVGENESWEDEGDKEKFRTRCQSDRSQRYKTDRCTDEKWKEGREEECELNNKRVRIERVMHSNVRSPKITESSSYPSSTCNAGIAEEQAASAVQTSRRVDESVDWYLNARDVKIHQNTPTNSPINSHMGAGTPYSDRCSAKTPSEEAGGVFDDYADGEQTTQKPIEILELNEDAAKSAILASDFVAKRVNSERDSIREAKLVERGQLLDGMNTEKRGNLAAYAVLHPDMESKTCSLRKEDSDLTVVGATQETISPTNEERTAQAHSISKVEWLKEKRAFLDELNIVKEERNKISAALKQMKDKHIKQNAEALKNMALTTDLLIIEQKKSEEAIQPLKAALVEKCNMVEELKKEASELRVKIKSNQERKESNEELRRQIRHLEMTQEREISSMRDRLQQEKAKDMEAMRKLLLKDHVEQIRTVQAKARSQQYELQLQEREAELARLKEVMQKWKSDALTKMEEEMARRLRGWQEEFLCDRTADLSLQDRVQKLEKMLDLRTSEVGKLRRLIHTQAKEHLSLERAYSDLRDRWKELQRDEGYV